MSEKLNLIKIVEKDFDIRKKKIKYFFSDNTWFGLTLLGRIMITIFSLEALFFIYNILIEFLLLFPGIIYEIKSNSWISWIYFIIFSLNYVFFAIFSHNVLVIPTYEFLSFPFLLFNNPLSHLYSFRYIKENKKFVTKSIIDENNIILNIFLTIFGFVYLCSYLLGFINIGIKDYIEIFIFIIIFIYYAIILFSYFLFSLKIFFLFIYNNY